MMKYLLALSFVAVASAFVMLDGSPQCDASFYYYEHTNSCYYQGDYQDFDGAERSCVSLGGHLTSIHDPYENSFVQSLTETGEKQNQEGMTWVGLHWVNNAWAWTDGTTFNYNWWMKGAPEKPSKYGCALLLQDDYSKQKNSKGEWDNTECKYKMRKYVCKKGSNY